MLLRKKTKLRIAYALLATTAVSVLAYDAERRSHDALRSAQTPPPPATRVAAMLPLVPLAQSPFPEASLANLLATESAATRPSPKAAAAREHPNTSSGIFFLKVAVEVPSKNGPLALNRGTRVHLIREQDGKLRVRRNSMDFLIEKSQVTDDLKELTALARNSS
jgi:hypothetical protein